MKTKIEKINNFFSGVIEVDKNTYTCDNAIKGESVEITLDEKNKKAKIIKVYNPSENRIPPLCEVYHKCGSCSMMHIKYEEQLKLKEQMVKDLYYDKYHKNFNFLPIIGSKNNLHYRNKNHFVFSFGSKNSHDIVSGFYEENTHHIVDFDKCYLHDEECNDIAATIKYLMQKMHYLPYDDKRQYGLIRHVIIKKGFATGEIMVVMVTAKPDFPGSNNFCKALVEKHPHIKTIIQNINSRFTSVILGEKEKILYGKGFIVDKLLECSFKISSKSFYQINPYQCKLLYEAAIKAADLKKSDVLLDAYCGVGTIGIVCSKYVKKVIGVEIVNDAVKDAITNAKFSNANNFSFINADATKYISELAQRNEHIDVVIMDPPRKGSDKIFLNAVCQLKPKKVIYISCDPRTQVNDVNYLLKDYIIKSIQCVDMFPYTSHVETVVCLERK